MSKKHLTLIIIILLFCLITVPINGAYEIRSFSIENNGNLSGYVKNSSSIPIEGALVRVHFHGTYEEDYSNSEGYYHVTNIPICYCLKNATCSKEGYKTEWVLLGIVEDTTYDFFLDQNGNNPPNAPSIYGPASGPPGTYCFIFNSIDPDGDDVKFYIDWGDGNSKETMFVNSGEDICEDHTYLTRGDFIITVYAEDIHGTQGPSSTAPVIIMRNRKIPILLIFRFLDNFPLLSILLSKSI
jgi:hypothetical protein